MNTISMFMDYKEDIIDNLKKGKTMKETYDILNLKEKTLGGTYNMFWSYIQRHDEIKRHVKKKSTGRGKSVSTKKYYEKKGKYYERD